MELPGREVSVLRALERAEQRQTIESGIRRLPPAAQEMLTLHYWDGRDCEEIGFLTGKSRAAIKVALHRARRELKPILEDEANALFLTDVTDWQLLSGQVAA